MCGIIGIVAKSPVNQLIYDALTVLQHRGQDAAGIVTCDGDHLFLRKGNGLVRDVFRGRHMRRLQGNMGIGHVRYPTAGCTSEEEAQPFYVNSPYGISLGHNGNLTNAAKLRNDLFVKDRRHMNTSSDSELLLNVFANALQDQNKVDLTPEDIFSAVASVHERCEGAYAAVAMITGYGLVAFRDPLGIRPAAFGYRDTAEGREYMVASESVALNTAGFTLERDIEPGEAVYVDLKGNLHVKQCAANPKYIPCIFEYVYLARPDSVIDKVPVHTSRLRMGKMLAQKIKREHPDHDIDVVIPVPDTSRTAAMQLAYHLGVMSREGFIKNRYIGRTFIMPDQGIRQKSVRQKLNPIDTEFRDKNVLLVDDSIVRGTTSRQIIQMVRDSGAKKVYFASAAPAVRYQNVYGIDMPAVKELAAHDQTDEKVGELIGADWLVFQDLEDLIESVRKENPAIEQFDTSVFDGHYPTGDITPEYLAQLEQERSDAAKAARDDEE